MKVRKRWLCALLLAAPGWGVQELGAFCGCMAPRAPGPSVELSKIYNSDSKVILTRKGKQTIITMTNDFRGAAGEFALIIPVPHVLPQESIRVVRATIFDSLDRYSAPRLVQYTDPDPCWNANRPRFGCGCAADRGAEDAAANTMSASGDAASGAAMAKFVNVEARYVVGEYEIVILSSQQSEALNAWLAANGYALPPEAEPVVQSYLQAGMKFFAAKVNPGAIYPSVVMDLSPLQIRFESENFMLPLRLGMINSAGEQDLTVFAFTERGRLEAANYPTREVPWGHKLPRGVRDTFPEFYRAMFRKNRLREGKNTVYVENAHPLNPWRGCDFCPVDPINYEFLQACGVDWIRPAQWGPGFSGDVYFTRMHLLYAPSDFPQDLTFIETANQNTMTALYEIWQPFQGGSSCKVSADEVNKDKNREATAKKTYDDLLADASSLRMRLLALGFRLERMIPRPEEVFAATHDPRAVGDFLLPFLMALPFAWGMRRRFRR
jgi:hypothetical protein